MSRFKLLELTTKERLDHILSHAEEYKEDDTYEVAELLSKRMRAPSQGSESNICFMDMRGEQELKPSDASLFEFLIFGGILGDHPP